MLSLFHAVRHCAAACRPARPTVARFGIDALERRVMLAADLTGSFAGAVPASLPPAATNRITVRVNNAGDEPAAGTVGVKLFASADGSLDDADTPLASVSKGLKLNPGKGANVKLAFPSPGDVPDGDYFLIARVDDGNAIPESDESNNVVASSSEVTIRQPFVDLAAAVTGLPATQLNLAVKHPKPAKATVVVTNNGNVPAKGTVAIDLYASTRSQLDSTAVGPLSLPARNVNIKPGKSKSFKAKIALPSTTPGGDYFVIAVITPGGGITDTTPANDTVASSSPITVLNAGGGPQSGPAFASPLDAGLAKVLVGQSDSASFQVSVAGATPSTGVEVDEVDASGNLIGKVTDLFDDGNGTHNDATAGDGVFNNTSVVGFDSPGQRFFVAKLTDSATGSAVQTEPAMVAGVDAPSAADVQQMLATSQAVTQQAATALAGGQAPQAVLDSVQAMLEASPDKAVPGSVQRGEHSVLWRLPGGYLAAVDTDDLQAQAAATANPPAALRAAPAAATAVPADSTADATAGSDCKKAVVFDPFQSELGSRAGTEAISEALKTKGWNVTSFVNATASDRNVTIDDFKNLGRYGVVYIVSHGDTYPHTPESTTVYTGQTVADVNIADAKYQDELLNDRMVVGDGTRLAVTDKFFSAYTGQMDGSIVYVGSCSSAVSPALPNAFLARGAKAFIGYTAVVHTQFSQGQGVQLFNTLLQDTNNTVGDVPGINQATDPDEPHALFKAFGDLTAKLKDKCDLLKDYDVFVQYSWPQTQKDLDTSTVFLGSAVGYSNDNNSPYLNWSGDNTSTGGTETVTANLYQAYTDGKITDSATINLDAGWFQPSNGTGPALVTVALKNKATGATKDAVQKTISPGTQDGAAATQVGVVTVSIKTDPGSTDPEVSFTLA